MRFLPRFNLTPYSLALPAQQFLSGGTAALGVLLVAGAALALAGETMAAAMAVGATCASIVDQPVPPGEKRLGFLIAFLFDSAVTLGIGLCGEWAHPLALGGQAAIVAFTAFAAAMITVYGKATLALCMSMILAAVFALGTNYPTPHGAAQHALLFAIGAAGYILYGLAAAEILAARHKRIALTETLAAFADYVRAKAALYDEATGIEASYSRLIEYQVTLMERVEAARNLLFRDLDNAQARRQAATLIALLDAFETILSSQTDYWLLRRHFGAKASSSGLLPLIHESVLHVAERIEAVARAIRSGNERDIAEAALPFGALRREFAALAAKAEQLAPAGQEPDPASERGAAQAELRATLERIGHAVDMVAKLEVVARSADAADASIRRVQLQDFLPPRPFRLKLLRRHLQWQSPILRYALRLTAAMLCAFALSAALTRYFSHGSWILLTVAVIMRASYSATRQRQKDRLIGNLVGCVLAAVALHLLPDAALLALAVACIGLSHAYAPVRYRVTSIAACVMALLMMHFLNPDHGSLLAERLLDTVLGAAIAVSFSFVFPYWERQGLPALTAALLRANRQYARLALKLKPPEQSYRLARKELFDAGANFAGALRRLATEPGADKAEMARLQAFLSASYRMMAQLAALHVLLRMRGAEIDPKSAETLLAERRERLTLLLGGKPSTAERDDINAEFEAAASGPTGGENPGEWAAIGSLLQRLAQAEAVARQINELTAQAG